MSGLGRKIFAAGEILTAANVNGYLMDQSVMVFDDAAARGSAIGTATEGMVAYTKDDNALSFYSGSVWTPVGLDPYTVTASTATAYTLEASDAGGALQFTAGTAVVTVGTATAFSAGQKVDILADSTDFTISAGTGVTFSGAGTSGTAISFTPGEQYEAVTVIGLGSNAYRIIGNISAV
jgi:hypothetical protein